MQTNDKAVTIDEYIENQSRALTAAELRGLRSLTPALLGKKNAALAQQRHKLARGIDTLLALLPTAAVEQAADPLPKHLAEAGAAARYVLKGADIIPDNLPELGLADDEWIVKRVLERNPELNPAD